MVLNPLISVILPVYNAEKFLNESINSILEQTYTHFELIIVNDGSTDTSQSIIDHYSDPRIRKINHTQNKGLVASLNEAIVSAKGDMIVRMDADDIAFKDRVQKQVQYLLDHPAIDIVGTHAVFFETNTQSPMANWELDLNTITPSSIKKALTWENCMIHPSICMRSEIAKSLLYNEHQKNYEDYDLWLRATADNINIAKIDESLLYYRVQPNSITQSSIRKENFYFQKAGVKYRFICNCLSKGKLNLFIIKVFLSTFADLFLGIGKSLKNNKRDSK
jgi:glycosyltransferase involved in cell wall biosynthesis